MRFAMALQAGKLISKQMLDQTTSSKTANYGCGFQLEQVGGARVFGHNGGAPGMSASLAIAPKTGRGDGCPEQ